ncbi:hypothetical protein RR48_15497 [Papilio machaon]|uniref:Uncharacterized protein n=1 Tax=Papilio machaon TaxID=76193 RepID=A0A194R0J0_PAPMA|nr:hypothetical protein RR48_15497 [Papilio machaon]
MEARFKNKLPQEGTVERGESLHGTGGCGNTSLPLSPCCPTYSGGGKILQPVSSEKKQEGRTEERRPEERKQEEKSEEITNPFVKKGLKRTPPTKKKEHQVADQLKRTLGNAQKEKGLNTGASSKFTP